MIYLYSKEELWWKNSILLLLSLLMTFTLTGCNQQVEKASSTQSVTLSLEQTSSQDVDVYVDQDQNWYFKKVKGAGTYELKLTKGNHEVKSCTRWWRN